MHKFAFDTHMLFIFDISVSEGELTSCEALYVSCMQHVINDFIIYVSFLYVMLFYFVCAKLFHFMDYHFMY